MASTVSTVFHRALFPGVSILIEACELDRCWHVGRQIAVAHDEEGISPNLCGLPNDEVKAMGLMGECALYKMMSKPMDAVFEVRTRCVANDTFDYTTNEGKTVDVKTTRSPTKQLCVHYKKQSNPADIYLLIQVPTPTPTGSRHPDGVLVRFIGATTRDNVYQQKNRDGEYYKVPRDQLGPFAFQ